MHTIVVRNVHQALPEGIRHLELAGDITKSRAGDCLVAPWPVMTVYERPLERMLFWEERHANPFFHVMEALWMLAGRNDVDWLVRFNSKMLDFSDNGRTFHGAYGYRWRKFFVWEDEPEAIDQFEFVVELLKRSPDSRRAVIQMWDCTVDLCVDEGVCVDIPCNTHIYLMRRDDRLDMTVMCRSNDMIWGAYGANAVHFSILQEYLAARLGWEVGKLYQFSNNYHAYLELFEKLRVLSRDAKDPGRQHELDPYSQEEVKPYPLASNIEIFDEELSLFMEDETVAKKDPYSNEFLNFARTIKNAYIVGKNWNQPREALELLSDLPADWDVGVACYQWMNRLAAKRAEEE